MIITEKIMEMLLDENILLEIVSKEESDNIPCLSGSYLAMAHKRGVIFLIRDDAESFSEKELGFVILHELGHLIAEGGWDSEEIADNFALKKMSAIYRMRSLEVQRLYRSVLRKIYLDAGISLEDLMLDKDYAFRSKYLVA